jgi:flagellar motor component MotA
VNFAIGLVIAVSSVIGGCAALGGHLEVLAQPFEFVIICGASLGVFIIGNTFATIKDSGKGIVEAITDKAPKPRDFLDVIGCARAGVEVLDVFFEGDDYLGSVSEKERLCAAISDARLR